MVDLDPQGNAGTGLGFIRAAHSQSVYNVIMGLSGAAENILSTAVPNLHILPSSPALSGADVALLDMDNREYRLRDALESVLVHYDYILFDCPPAAGYLTINALTTATHFLVPLQCEFYALDGLQQLLATTDEIQAKWNQNLKMLGILLTMAQKNNLSRAIEADVRETFGDTVFKTMIPRNIRVSEAPSHGKPALFYDFNSSGAQSYLRVASEIVERLDSNQ